MTLSWRWMVIGLIAGVATVSAQPAPAPVPATSPDAAAEEAPYDYTACPDTVDAVAKLMAESSFGTQLAACKVTIAQAQAAAEKETGGKATAVNFTKDGTDLAIEVTVIKGAESVLVKINPTDGKVMDSSSGHVDFFPGQDVTGKPTKTDSGLMFYDMKAGDGDAVAGDGEEVSMIELHFAAWFLDGTLWNSSWKRGQTMKIPSDDRSLPEGWKEALSTMKSGGMRKLIVPGKLGFPPMVRSVPQNAAMIVDIEIVDIPARTKPVTKEEIEAARKLGNAVEGEPTKTESGVYFWDVKVGEGEQPADLNARAKINYTGYLADGTQFDTSEGKPMRAMALSGFVKGYGEGVSTMKVGGKRKIIIPARLGYGVAERGEIPAAATLIFDVELVEIVKTPAPQPGAGMPQMMPGGAPNQPQIQVKPAAPKTEPAAKPEEKK